MIVYKLEASEVNNRLIGWAFVHQVNYFAQPVNNFARKKWAPQVWTKFTKTEKPHEGSPTIDNTSLKSININCSLDNIITP